MDPEEVEDYMHQLEENEESGQEDLLDQASVEEEEEEEEQRGEKNKEEEQMSTPSEQQSVAKRFRDAYMAKVTQAFGSDLDQIRQEPTLDGPRLNILIDSLEAGIDIFSSLEQEIEL